MIHVKHSIIPIDIIEEMIALGEGYKTEFRDNLPPIQDLARTFCAFANTKGGNLFIGISSSGETVHNLDKYGDISRAEEAIALLSPSPAFVVQAVDFKNNEIILITVQEGDMKPYFVQEDDGENAYIRTGNVNTPATKKELKRL
jgi:ATP-dependent DNA helicase RecG